MVNKPSLSVLGRFYQMALSSTEPPSPHPILKIIENKGGSLSSVYFYSGFIVYNVAVQGTA